AAAAFTGGPAASARAFTTSRAAVTDDEPVDPPGLPVEESRLTGQPERAIQRPILLVRLQKAIDVDADVGDDGACVLVVAVPRLDVQRAAGQRQHAALVAELVPLGVAAEVVVVVENQDFRAPADVADEEIRCRQTAQAAADDDEIVRLAGVVRAGQIPLPPIAELMRHFERSGMAAAHA